MPPELPLPKNIYPIPPPPALEQNDILPKLAQINDLHYSILIYNNSIEDFNEFCKLKNNIELKNIKNDLIILNDKLNNELIEKIQKTSLLEEKYEELKRIKNMKNNI